jgi:hypothetical protein
VYTKYYLLNVFILILAIIFCYNSMLNLIKDIDLIIRKLKIEIIAKQAGIHVNLENATSML